MKFITVRDIKANFSGTIRDAQTSRVVVTNHGRPVALLVGVEGLDLETVVMSTDEELMALAAKRLKK